MRPEGSMMNPEPSDAARGADGLPLPGAPFSPKKSRKNSSRGAPGAGSCASGPPLEFGDGVACVVETLTTTPTNFAANWAKTSEKGVASGASARLGSGARSNSINNTKRMALRPTKDVTQYLLRASTNNPGASALAFS